MTRKQVFSSNLQLENPVKDFRVEFAVSEINAGFASGEADYIVERPSFNITGVRFSGLNALQENGVEIVNQVQIYIDVSGKLKNDFGFETENNSGASNIEKVRIYTGFSPDFNVAPDLFDFEKLVTIDPNNASASFSLNSSDLGGNTGLIYYKILPFDRLNSGELGPTVSGSMFTGFNPQTIISSDLTISPNNLNDRAYDQRTLTLVDGVDNIFFDTGIADQFSVGLEVRTDDIITLTGLNTGVQFVNPLESSTYKDGMNISGNFVIYSASKDSLEPDLFVIRLES